MGKYAQYMKRGRAIQHGNLAGPPAADFNIGTPAVPNTNVNRTGALPGGGTEWSPRSIRVGVGTVAQGGISAGTPISVPTSIAATQYTIQVSYYNAAGIRVSDWTTVGTITTP